MKTLLILVIALVLGIVSTAAKTPEITVEVSLFHDDDGIFEMKTDNRGPQEGYATEKCSLPAGTNAAKPHLHYPAAENGQSPAHRPVKTNGQSK